MSAVTSYGQAPSIRVNVKSYRSSRRLSSAPVEIIMLTHICNLFSYVT